MYACELQVVMRPVPFLTCHSYNFLGEKMSDNNRIFIRKNDNVRTFSPS